MSNAEASEVLKKGNIVEIIVSDDENLRGCRGEVITEDPLTIAVLHVLPFDANQLRKIFDASEATKAELTDEADKLGIKVKTKDTLDEIAAKIKELHQHEGCIECEVGEAGGGNAVAESATFSSDSASAASIFPVPPLPPSASAAPPLTSRSPEPSPPAGRINVGDCVLVKAHPRPNARVCTIQGSGDAAKYGVVFFTPSGKRRSGEFTKRQVDKLSSCPTGDDAPPSCS